MLTELRIPLIGLAGPTGAGKSTAAGMLAELGCGILDGDALSREITAPGSPVLAQLATRFGEDICKGESLDRVLLAERAFASEKARQDLNSITHPAITALALTKAKALQGKRALVFDAAALLESGDMAQACDHFIIITAPEALRLTRILQRGGISEQAARQRIAAQTHMDFTPPAGVGFTVIDSTGGEAVLRDAIEKAFQAVVSERGTNGNCRCE